MNYIRRLSFLFAIALASGPLLAQVNALPPSRHILVYGEAHARAIPDRFKVSIQFEAADFSPDVARRAVETDVANVLAKLKAADVPEAEIVATSLQIGTRHRYDQKLQEQVFAGTQVTRSLSARFAGKADLERFLASVRTSQGLRISNVSTELSSEVELRKALREKAIESSRDKADVIARAYGARLGAVYSVSDVAPQFDYGVREGQWPGSYEWDRGVLHRVQVTGSRVSPPAPNAPAVALQSGYVDFNDKIYTVFLLAD